MFLFFRNFVKKEKMIFFLFVFFRLAKTGLIFLVPWLVKNLIDKILPLKDMRMLILYAVFFLTAKLSLIGVTSYNAFLATNLKEKFDNFWKKRILSSLLFAKSSSIDKKGVGYLSERIEHDITEIGHFVLFFVLEFFVNIFMIFMLFIWSVRINFWVAAIFLFVSPLHFFSLKFFNKKLKKSSDELFEVVARKRNLLIDILQGRQEIKIFAIADLIVKKYEKILMAHYEKVLKRFYEGLKPSILGQLSSVLGYFLLFFVAGYENIHGRLSIGSFVFFYSILGQLLSSVGNLIDINVQYQTALAASQRVKVILSYEKEDESGEEIDEISRLTGKNVSYWYNKTEIILKNLNFSVEKGDIVAVTGANGKGKTTLFSIISGILMPKKGELSINEIPLSNISVPIYRKRISIVRQVPFIFADTIKENLLVAKQCASDMELETALKRVSLWNFVKELPGGLNFILEEGGKNISGGERQRLVLARAFLKESELLLLDEAMNGIDEENRSKIWDYLLKTRKNRILFFISHNSSEIKFANKVIGFD